MKYLAVLQSEFIKEAMRWDDFSWDEQREYLQNHPKSKRRITAIPKLNDNDQQRIDKDAARYAEAPTYWLRELTKTDLRIRQREFSAVQRSMSGNDDRFETYQKALSNISLALANKNKKRHKPTGGPGVMPVWIGGRRAR